MIWIRSVTVLEEFLVRLEFSDGTQNVVNLAPLLHGPIFEPLRADINLFRTVHVDDELGTIAWANGADMDPDVLYGSHIPAWMETTAGVIV
ncbi:MAG: DUF2442 domain-containing protein [Roseiflexaceae bacterium]|nr:DUF2442 domain-containing protein [Roseiflexaceae bacterium]